MRSVPVYLYKLQQTLLLCKWLWNSLSNLSRVWRFSFHFLCLIRIEDLNIQSTSWIQSMEWLYPAHRPSSMAWGSGEPQNGTWWQEGDQRVTEAWPPSGHFAGHHSHSHTFPATDTHCIPCAGVRAGAADEAGGARATTACSRSQWELLPPPLHAPGHIYSCQHHLLQSRAGAPVQSWSCHHYYMFWTGARAVATTTASSCPSPDSDHKEPCSPDLA